MSMPPPGGNPTTIRTGLVGNSACAKLWLATSELAAAPSIKRRRVVEVITAVLPVPVVTAAGEHYALTDASRLDLNQLVLVPTRDFFASTAHAWFWIFLLNGFVSRVSNRPTTQFPLGLDYS